MRSTILLTALAAVFVAPAAMADRDDHEHGNGHGKGHGKHKEEYWDGNCKVERKWKHGEYEEKRKCREPETVIVVPERRERERVIVVPERRAPETIVVMPARPMPPPPVQPVYVYPPWIVQQQGQYAYAPQHQPQQVVTGVSRCNSQAVGQVLGGVVGGVLGNQIGQGHGRTAATIGGAVAGVLVGGEVGRRMDAANQGCVGEVLEVAPVNHRVQWVEGPSTYVVVPAKVVSRGGSYCRPYTVEVRGPHGVQRSNGTACRRHDGVWVRA
jgi:surface antigen